MVFGFGFISGASFSVHSIAPVAIRSRDNKPQHRQAVMYAGILSSTDSKREKKASVVPGQRMRAVRENIEDYSEVCTLLLCPSPPTGPQECCANIFSSPISLPLG